MKPGYTTMGYKSGNALGASNRATLRAHAATRRGVGNAQTYMGQRTALRAKELGA